MGSAALRDAITGIIDWGETVGRVGGDLPRATEAFGSLTFNDEVQKSRLAKPIYAGASPDHLAGRAARAPPSPTPWPRR